MLSAGPIAGIVIGGLVLSLVCGAACWYLDYRRRKALSLMQDSVDLGTSCLTYAKLLVIVVVAITPQLQLTRSLQLFSVHLLHHNNVHACSMYQQLPLPLALELSKNTPGKHLDKEMDARPSVFVGGFDSVYSAEV